MHWHVLYCDHIVQWDCNTESSVTIPVTHRYTLPQHFATTTGSVAWAFCPCLVLPGTTYFGRVYRAMVIDHHVILQTKCIVLLHDNLHVKIRCNPYIQWRTEIQVGRVIMACLHGRNGGIPSIVAYLRSDVVNVRLYDWLWTHNQSRRLQPGFNSNVPPRCIISRALEVEECVQRTELAWRCCIFAHLCGHNWFCQT